MEAMKSVVYYDRSYRNRIKAIETIYGIGYESLYFLVDEMQSTEKNDDVIGTIEYFKDDAFVKSRG